MNIRKLSLLVASSVCLANVSYALPYVDANFGYTGVTSSSFNQDITHLSGEERKHFGWNANAGYAFNQSLAVDAGYTQYADMDYRATGNYSATTGHYSYHVAVKGTIESDRIFFFGKLGPGFLNHGKISIPAIQTQISSKTNVGLFWAVGVGGRLDKHWYMQAQFQEINLAKNNPTIYMASAGVGYQF